MKRDSRLSRMLHVLVHMERHEGSATSEAIAKMLGTNPVVVRRTMAGLREHGYVTSVKGPGGGWTLARPLDAISLGDIHRALDSPPIFALAAAVDHAGCLVEQAVNATLKAAFDEAERTLLARLDGVSLGDIARDHARRARRKPPRGKG
ncbi:MAG TPA: Rrf2 family transcriptional regulator [Tahibacter sp.]|uniref:Rrf2 family transcriptional regulator n=1 Tax=Tahibacter sp. TaxID=2056211 RepID=UPI002BE5EFFB|nr:Rrf2 family transcriptional regulator [Tahibacter sp.]HSX63008.1 Rrf2 family transcriptional regulator [Tahibacter sp.]